MPCLSVVDRPADQTQVTGCVWLLGQGKPEGFVRGRHLCNSHECKHVHGPWHSPAHRFSTSRKSFWRFHQLCCLCSCVQSGFESTRSRRQRVNDYIMMHQATSCYLTWNSYASSLWGYGCSCDERSCCRHRNHLWRSTADRCLRCGENWRGSLVEQILGVDLAHVGQILIILSNTFNLSGSAVSDDCADMPDPLEEEKHLPMD